MKKLKGMDFKALFINHGEKFGFAIIILIVVIALSGTTWSRYEKSPGDLERKITDAKNRIHAATNVWPAAKSEQYSVVDFNGQAQSVFTGMQTAKYEFTTPMFWPLYRKKEKAREPEFSPALYLIADAGVASLGINDQPNFSTEMADNPGAPTTTEPDSESTLKPGPAQPGGAAGPAGATAFGISPIAPGAPGAAGKGHAGAGGAGGHASKAGSGSGGHASRGPTGGHGAAATAMMPEGMGAMYGSGGMSGGVTARGKRYVAVRAIVPIKEQIERAMKALNMSYADASNAIEYTDFTLERQAAVSGAESGKDPWTGEWEVVNKKFALDVLQTCSDFDPDPVPADLQDAVFTMPLPYRLLRYWGDHATHPNIKNFQLSEADMEKEKQLYSKMMEEIEKFQLETKPKVEKKGLALAVNDMRGAGRVLSQNADAMRGMMQSMNEMNPGNAPRMGVADLQSRLTASGRVYLFRYFDFDVLPGMAYRYRVKLELRNPNFERPYEEVEDQEVTKRPYRETAWSNISNPTVVPDTVQYFLKDVERDPVRDEKHSKKAVASIAMFEWDEKYGTMLADSLRILNVGQFIAEKKKSWVLDPGTPTFEEKDVTFATEDLLVDASGDMEIAPELHPDLKLKPEKGKKDAKVGIRPEALVATGFGELEELDPAKNYRDKASLDQRVEEERKNFQYLKDAPQQTNSVLDGAGYPGLGAMPGINQPQKASSRDPRKRGGSAGGPAGGHGGAAGGEAGGPGGSRSSPPGARSSRPPGR